MSVVTDKRRNCPLKRSGRNEEGGDMEILVSQEPGTAVNSDTLARRRRLGWKSINRPAGKIIDFRVLGGYWIKEIVKRVDVVENDRHNMTAFSDWSVLTG